MADDVDGRHATWRSIWWALIAIALNAFMQKSGKMLALRAGNGAVTALSPILRLADALILWARLLRAVLVEKHPPKRVVRVIVADRLSGASQRGVAEGSWWLRPAVFALGALPQYIKVFAISGIPWTQAWAAMYLFSFITLETFLYFGRAPPRREGDDDDDTAFAEDRRQEISASSGRSHALELTVTALCATLQVFFALWVHSHVLRLAERRGSLHMWSILGLVTIPVGLTMVELIIFATLAPHLYDGFHGSVIVLPRPLPSIQPKNTLPIVYGYAIFLNTVLYYMYVFDSTTTYKAPWVENLG